MLTAIQPPAALASDYDHACDLMNVSMSVPQLLPNAISALKQLLQACPPEAQDFRGLLLSSLGTAYHKLGESMGASALDAAVQSFEAALTCRPPDRDPERRATTLVNMGNTLTDYQGQHRPAMMERGIKAYEEALLYLTPEQATAYHNCLNGLGSAYAERVQGDPADNARRALDYYQAALAPLGPSDLREAARIQVNMGHAYRAMHRLGDRQASAKAIECYEFANKLSTFVGAGEELVDGLSGLGSAYNEARTGDLVNNQEAAISAYEAAVAASGSEPHGANYGRVMNNLGNAYRRRKLADREENLRTAVRCYEGALAQFPPNVHPHEQATAHNGLGLAVLDLPGNPRKRALAAVAHFDKALSCWTSTSDPVNYNHALGNRARALLTLDVESALESYAEALAACDPGTLPYEYARTEMNRGNAFRLRTVGDQATNSAAAVRCFEEALRYFTLEADPAGHRAASGNLGSTLFERGDYAEAHRALSSALAANEALYLAGATSASRQAEMGEVKPLHALDAACLIRLGDLRGAVERLEAGRTTVVREALEMDLADLEHLDPASREAFEAARDSLREAEEAVRRHMSDPARDASRYVTLSKTVAEARAELKAVGEQIRSKAPDFLRTDVPFAEVASAASATCPLVYIATVAQESLVLIVTACDEPTAYWLPFTESDLERLLLSRDSEGTPVGGLIAAQRSGDIAHLDAALVDVSSVAVPRLVEPLAQHLADAQFSEATLVLLGRLSLLPLSSLFRFPFAVAVAPSGFLLKRARALAQILDLRQPRLLAVEDPVPPPAPAQSLRFAHAEVARIRRWFPDDRQRVLPAEQATLSAVMDAVGAASYVHFACHGTFRPSLPLRSGLALADGQWLTVADLLSGKGWSTTVRLAVLSACQTGLSDYEVAPDELVGMPVGFVVSGTPAVVASLWSVDDLSTAILMNEFYRCIFEDGMPPSRALAASIRFLQGRASDLKLAAWFDWCADNSDPSDSSLREAAEHYRAHPEARPFRPKRYWAGFVLTGC